MADRTGDESCSLEVAAVDGLPCFDQQQVGEPNVEPGVPLDRQGDSIARHVRHGRLTEQADSFLWSDGTYSYFSLVYESC